MLVLQHLGQKHPHILMVFEVGTATMMAAKGAIKPMYQLMDEAGVEFNPEGFIGPVKVITPLHRVKCFQCHIIHQHLYCG